MNVLRISETKFCRQQPKLITETKRSSAKRTLESCQFERFSPSVPQNGHW